MARVVPAYRQQDGPPSRDVALAAHAVAHHAIATYEELLCLGFSSSGVHRLGRAGRLHRLYRGVYAIGHPDVTVQGKRLAAVRAVGPGALLSHATALDAYAIRRSASPRIDVLTTRHSGTAPWPIRLHRTRSLHPDDIVVRDRIPIVSVARALVDFAATVTFHDVERAVHEAEVQRLLDVAAVKAVLGRSNGRAGTGKVAKAIAEHSPGPTKRGLEDAFLALLRRHEIELPALNARVPVPGATSEVDALWPHQRLVIELAGAAVHQTRQAFETDRARDAALTEEGYAVVRLTWRRVTGEPEAVAAQLRRLLARRGTPGARPHPA